MIRHIVLFRWKEGVTDADIASVQTSLDGLPPAIPAIRTYVHGPDLRIGEGSWDYGIVADFDDADAWQIYDADTEHSRVRAEIIRPLIAERATVRIDLG
jgi:Stress responsive A/B Barrel Domain